MKGRDLDRAIAEEVMGWKSEIDPTGGVPYEIWTSPDGSVVKVADDWVPSEFMNDAFSVVEKMKKKGWGFVLSTHDDDGRYCAMFNSVKPHVEVEHSHKSSAIAICLAALEAVREAKKKA